VVAGNYPESAVSNKRAAERVVPGSLLPGTTR